MGNLVKMPHSEVTATLEALDREGVLPEELARVRKDDSLRKKVAELLKSGKPASKKKPAYLIRAIRILGERRVFSPEQVASALNPFRKRVGLPELVPPQGVEIPYSDEVLKKHADGKWLLIYSYGLSLREQRQMVGVDPNHQPCVYNNDWWLKQKEDSWATKGVKPGWYLVCLEGRYGSQTWQSQEESIQKEWGQDYDRADEHLMGEAYLSAFLITRERPLGNFYHWGKSLGSDGSRVGVGRFDRVGLYVDGYWGGGYDDYLRVCLLRKFQ